MFIQKVPEISIAAFLKNTINNVQLTSENSLFFDKFIRTLKFITGTKICKQSSWTKPDRFTLKSLLYAWARRIHSKKLARKKSVNDCDQSRREQLFPFFSFTTILWTARETQEKSLFSLLFLKFWFSSLFRSKKIL